MKRPLIVTGIDLPMEPSCGSTIWCSDVYQRLAGDFRVLYLGLPGSGTWKHNFPETALLTADKQPYGPDFDAYAAQLTDEVADLIGEHQPDLIHAQHLGFGLALAFARAAGTIPVVSVAHGTDVIAAAGSEQALKVLTEIVAASTKVVVPNTAMGFEVDRLTRHAYTDRLTTIPWGLPLPPAPTARPRPGPRLDLLHAGRLDANKSTITAIQAIALTQDTHHLTVIGSGSELPLLKERTQRLGLGDQVTFEPFLPREELWQRFPGFDALVFTTRQLEAFGLVAVEAQAHGLPILYGDLPGLGHTLGDGGVAYRPGDAPALAALIDRVAADEALRQDLHGAATANARRHNIANTTAQMTRLSQTAIEGRR
ncbi:glycosyltransferase family 4 protein [Streptomyces turgidiscabies]|uniref:Glycosyltransferase, group 1 family protein n=1 Tax=Streptomyces turgidiscabies (strain Car8) TaxID=698760 RepID=L7ERY6_STRT8|nr:MULTISPECIES: glycosyltransferase family 4 protein [Streptomyces]ELP61486.1 glycosyltransferase, group 1 family protein [Streptomyces turgidiscabies Car8]MDX3497284.1 glycosyltransferase family 4 protein [Streptomyces turgidiscabies]GAQ68619.1 glycogen synthase [Streptomyces turgidiscabies]